MTAATSTASRQLVDRVRQALLEPASVEAARQLRRELHVHPELARQERRTTALAAKRLKEVGICVHLLEGTGLVADLGSRAPRRRVALRADLDALPIMERTGLPYASSIPGVCHACGHDVHTAAVVAAACGLASVQQELADADLAVRIILQPAEEAMPGGALDVIAQGGHLGLDAIFAVHCDPGLEVGQVGVRVGALTAAADRITVTLRGAGGHSSRPHLTQDLTYALARVVTDVPAILSRRVDPRIGLSVVWGRIQAGDAGNVIPDSGLVSGTVRMLAQPAWAEVSGLLDDVVRSVAAPYGVQVEVQHVRGVPAVVNDAQAVAAFSAGIAYAKLNQVLADQSLGGEDFAWYLQHVPGAMARLGTRSVGGPAADLHQGGLLIDEAAIQYGAQVLALTALVSLAA